MGDKSAAVMAAIAALLDASNRAQQAFNGT